MFLKKIASFLAVFLFFLQMSCSVDSADILLSGVSIFPKYELSGNELRVTGRVNVIDKISYEVGLVYSRKRDTPTIKKDTHKKITTVIKSGNFDAKILLEWNKLYYVRIYIKNKKRIFYSKPKRIFVGAKP